MKITRPIITALVLGIVLSSCVPKKKYTQMTTLKNSMQDMLERRNEEIEDLKEKLAKERLATSDCEDARSELARDTAALQQKLRASAGDMSDLQASCDQLNDNYQQLKAQSSNKMRELVSQLERLQEDLSIREARLTEVESKLARRDSTMQALQDRLTDALLGFAKDGLTVDIKNGKVYVSLSNKLLFASGSTKIDANGQKALADVAQVLAGREDITIMVEGHTDDVPVSNLGQITDNWDLSVMRSTEVVRLLVENGIAPKRIIPSGRSEFLPRVAESTTEASAVNRRTEIIISPKLDELYEIISKSSTTDL
ncbi:MAG: OmpA family protein [Bacteroidota bacterium]